MLYRCIYVSKLASDIGDDALRDVLAAIARTSSRNNRIMRLSGLLLSIDRMFIQILEGNNRQLTKLIGTLYGDDRHTDMAIVEFIAVERRIFPDWSMKVAPVRRRPEATVTDRGPEKLTAGAILNLAKAVRAGLKTTEPGSDAAEVPAEVYI